VSEIYHGNKFHRDIAIEDIVLESTFIGTHTRGNKTKNENSTS